MSTRIIKKYPNRRLYDTEQSRYITLADLQQLVIEGVDFQVKDANSGIDLTRNILLQIISDQENAGKPMFTTEILMRIIRFYGNSVQGALTQFLSQSLNLFEEQQKAVQEQLQGTLRENPMTALMTEMTQKNLQIWEGVQSDFLKAAGLSPPPDDDKTS